jgi:hypothetical protein
MPPFVGSGASHAIGAVPDPGAVAGTSKYLREDASWATPAGGGGGSNTLYAPGSFTVADGNFSIFADELSLTGSQEASLEGSATLALI